MIQPKPLRNTARAANMFIARRINQTTKAVELWECEWETSPGEMAKKVYRRRISEESFTEDPAEDVQAEANAICWSPGRTIGNIAINSEAILGCFSSRTGDNAVLPCDIVNAGKFRNGARRWYCRTHQTHWGTKADFQAAGQSGELRCSNHARAMNYVLDPLQLRFDDYAEIGIWCSLPPALSSQPIAARPPKIHIHARHAEQAQKLIDQDFDAVSLLYNQDLGLFNSAEISKVHVTPPAAFEFIRSIEEGIATSCVNCNRCGYPHLDLGDFATTPHRKHFCGNCGSDNIWTSQPIVSTPLKPLHDQFAKSNTYIVPNRAIDLDLDKYAGCDYEIWSSTPAVLWTANRAQEKGIHVHVTQKDGVRIEDDTFAEVRLDGAVLDRRALWETMKSHLIV